ncbi:MAG: hypothetical protein AAFV37_01555, partial [Pseudomonadota bacterium]
QGMDASFVALETPNSPMHIGSILIYDPICIGEFGVSSATNEASMPCSCSIISSQVSLTGTYLRPLMQTDWEMYDGF